MKKSVLVFLLPALYGCIPVKYIPATDGPTATGILTLSYTYTRLEAPQLQWDSALKLAITRCRASGYSGAEFLDHGSETCIFWNDRYHKCDQWKVEYKVLCTK